MGKCSGKVRNKVCQIALGVAGAIALSTAGAYAQLPAGTTYYGYNLSPAGSNSSQAGGGVSYGATGTLTAGYANDTNGNPNALLWQGTSNTPTNLNGTLGSSSAYAVSGTSVATSVAVGYGLVSGQYHAYQWTGGSASNGFDLNPTNYSYSTASGVTGSAGANSVTVGYGYGAATNGDTHALLWTGSTTTPTDLTPTNLTGISNTYASAVSGASGASVTVGFGLDGSNRYHALLWTNTGTNNVTDLTGSLINAFADGVSGTGATSVTVGYGAGSDGITHALLWTGTSPTATVLGSTGFSSSYAYGVSGTGSASRTVGYGVDAQNKNHALLWIPSNASAIDLTQFLPSSFTNVYTSTVANGVNGRGDIVGTGTDAQGHTAAFILTLGNAPEPGSVALFATGAVLPFLTLRKRLRRATIV